MAAYLLDTWLAQFSAASTMAQIQARYLNLFAGIDSLVPRLTDFETAAVKLIVGSVKRSSTGIPSLNNDGFLRRPGPLAFRRFDRKVIALELIERVLDPVRINQAGHSVCGAVVFMQSVARENPISYVQYATSIADGNPGVITVGGSSMTVTVDNDSNIWNVLANQAGIAQADYVTLVPLRDSRAYPYESWWTLKVFAGGTTVDTVADWMRNAGYGSVRDFTLPRILGATPTSALTAAMAKSLMRDNLTQARDLRDVGRTVFLAVAHPLAEEALGIDRSRNSLSGKIKNQVMIIAGGHWVYLNGLTVADDSVRFDITTWGQNTANLVDMPWSKVGSWYRGFISGNPGG